MPARSRHRLSRKCLAEILSRKRPVYEAPEALEILGACVTKIDVVGMFPYVTGQQRDVRRCQWCRCVAGVDDIYRTVRLFNEPGPARAEIASRGLIEGFFERSNAAPLGLNRIPKLAGWFATRIRCHAVPVERVVPDLRCVVEHTTRRFLDDFFK